jgi:hypothetical protein
MSRLSANQARRVRRSSVAAMRRPAMKSTAALAKMSDTIGRLHAA